MNEDFILKVRREDKFRHVSEIPMGEVLNENRTNVIIPECCREGWPSCPHGVKKKGRVRKNVGL